MPLAKDTDRGGARLHRYRQRHFLLPRLRHSRRKYGRVGKSSRRGQMWVLERPQIRSLTILHKDLLVLRHRSGGRFLPADGIWLRHVLPQRLLAVSRDRDCQVSK